MKVLIVEDDAAIRGIMEKTVQRAGYETISAPDGAQGLKFFKEFQPELVFSDIDMPVMTGLEMLEKIRNIDANSLFIIISTLDSPEFILQALRLKANDYLVKPALGKKLTDLLNKYAAIINGRTKTREVLGMIYSMSLGMKIGNDLGIVSRIVDRLMLETDQFIAPSDRIGVHLGLFEMLTNSIEHGSLEISYEEKSAAIESEAQTWKSFLQQRYQNPLYSSRVVCLEYQLSKDRCEWLITDEGPGFDWKSIPDPANPENLLASHGRGVMLATLQFDEVTYNDKGNQVRLVKRLS